MHLQAHDKVDREKYDQHVQETAHRFDRDPAGHLTERINLTLRTIERMTYHAASRRGLR